MNYNYLKLLIAALILAFISITSVYGETILDSPITDSETFEDPTTVTIISDSVEEAIYGVNITGDTTLVTFLDDATITIVKTDAGSGTAYGLDALKGAKINFANPDAITKLNVTNAGDDTYSYVDWYPWPFLNATAFGVSAVTDSSISFAGITDITVENTNTETFGPVYGLYASYGGDMLSDDIGSLGGNISFANTLTLRVTNGGLGSTFGVRAGGYNYYGVYDSFISFAGAAGVEVINTNAANYNDIYGLYASYGGNISFKDILTLKVTNSGMGNTYGVYANTPYSSVTFAGSADIEVKNNNEANDRYGYIYGLYASYADIDFANHNAAVTLKVINSGKNTITTGVYVSGTDSCITFAGSADIEVKNTNEANNQAVYGIMNWGSKIHFASDLTLKVINASTDPANYSSTTGTFGDGIITFAGKTDIEVNKMAGGGYVLCGLWSYGNGNISFTESSDLKLKVINGGTSDTYGARANGYGDAGLGDYDPGAASIIFAGNVDIKAVNTNETGSAYSLYTDSHGEIFLNAGNLVGTDNIVKLTGDIYSTGANSAIYANLTNDNSYLSGLMNEANGGIVSILFSNSAAWQPTGDSDSLSIATVTFDNGIVDLAYWYNRSDVNNPSNDFRTITLGGTTTITDKNMTLIINSDVENDTADWFVVQQLTSNNANSFDVSVKVAWDSVMSTLNGDSIYLYANTEVPVFTIQDVNGVDPVMNPVGITSVINTVLYGYTLKPYVVLSSDDPYTVVLTALDITTEPSIAAKAVSDGVTIPFIWLLRNDTLLSRMGDIRNNYDNSVNGVWARVYNSFLNTKSTDDRHITMSTNNYEIGFDKVNESSNGDRSVYGLVLNYLSSNNGFAAGNGKIDNAGIGVYGTFIKDNGSYLDIIAKAGTFDGKFAVLDGNDDIVSAKYNTWLAMFSAEYGVRKAFDHGYSIEPQAQITLGRINKFSYAASNGLNAAYDTIYSAVGRIGFVGYQKFDKDEWFLGCSVLHDFSNVPKVTASYDGDVLVLHPHITNTYFDINAGANVKLSENGYGYFEVSRLFGSKIGNNYKVNAGVYYKF